MKAIETRYKGYRFRSRLEARWAVFFDALGLTWEYEKEGFELSGGARYLPDFFIHWHDLPGLGYWVEIKGQVPQVSEMANVMQLAQESGHHAYILQGDPYDFTYWAVCSDGAHAPSGRCAGFKEWSAVAPFIVCPKDAVTPERFAQAAKKARSARFEHGEVPM